MQPFERQTARLYYTDMYLRRACATVVKLGDDFLELDATIAYPEGGGQEADVGTIKTEGGNILRFVGAKMLFGRMIFLDDFPNIQVEGIIRHLIHPDDVCVIKTLGIGDRVEIELDIERRARLSLSHTASHLLYAGITKVRPDAVARTLGCHIKIDGARFDFSVAERFTPEQLTAISGIANQIVARKSPIDLYAHTAEPDARYWRCEDYVIPCGGTHIHNAGPVDTLIIRRKGLGKGRERISCEFPNAYFDLEKYHT